MNQMVSAGVEFLKNYLKEPVADSYYLYDVQGKKDWLPTRPVKGREVFDMYPYYGLTSSEGLINGYISSCSYKVYGSKRQEDVLEVKFLQITLRHEFRNENGLLIGREEIAQQLQEQIFQQKDIPLPTYFTIARYVYLLYEFGTPVVLTKENRKELTGKIKKAGEKICEIINKKDKRFNARTKGINDKILLPDSFQLKYASKFNRESYYEQAEMYKFADAISLETLLTFYPEEEKFPKKTSETLFLEQIFQKKDMESFFLTVCGKRERFCKSLQIIDSTQISIPWYKEEDKDLEKSILPGFLVTIYVAEKFKNQTKRELLLAKEIERPTLIFEKENALQYFYLLERPVSFEEEEALKQLLLRKKEVEESIGYLLRKKTIPYELMWTNLGEQFLEVEKGMFFEKLLLISQDDEGKPLYLKLAECEEKELQELPGMMEMVDYFREYTFDSEEEELLAEMDSQNCIYKEEKEECIEEISPTYVLTKVKIIKQEKLGNRTEGIVKRRIHQIINFLYETDFDLREWQIRRVMFLLLNYICQIVTPYEEACSWIYRLNRVLKKPLRPENVKQVITTFFKQYNQKGAYRFKNESFAKLLGLEGDEELQDKIGMKFFLRDLERMEQRRLKKYEKERENYELLNFMKIHREMTYSEVAAGIGRSDRWVKKRLKEIGYSKGKAIENYLNEPQLLPIIASEIFDEKEIIYGMEL